MSDLKSKLPDLKELGEITGKLLKDIKVSVGEIMRDYKQKRAEAAKTEASAEKTENAKDKAEVAATASKEAKHAAKEAESAAEEADKASEDVAKSEANKEK